MKLSPLDLHPEHAGKRYTLSGLYEDEARAERTAIRDRNSGKAAILFPLDTPSKSTLFAVATREEAVRQRRSRLPHEYAAAWLATRVALEAFRAAERAARRRGTPLRWYKELDERTIHRILGQMRWTGTVLEVTGRLISNLVIAHPFPNANHRTSTSLARLYLAAEGVEWPPYALQGRGIDRFIRETDPFVLRSKFLLHLLRHGPMFKIAHAAGFREAIVKNTKPPVPLEIEEIEADKPAIIQKHEASCRAMVSTIDGGKNQDGLNRPARKGLREWMNLYGAEER